MKEQMIQIGKDLEQDTLTEKEAQIKLMDMEYGYYWVKYDCYKVVISEWTENKDGEDYWAFIGDKYEYEKDMCEVISFIPQIT